MLDYVSHIFQNGALHKRDTLSLGNDMGQATIEAVFAIPLMFCLLLILMQPTILLYDHIVMGNAAAESCRLLATSTASLANMDNANQAFVRHRLTSIPQHDCFHVHSNGCSWDIDLSGDEASQTVTVTIKNKVKPLPLIDGAMRAGGLLDGDGCYEITKSVTMQTQPDWVRSSVGDTLPGEWVGSWI